MAGDRSAVSGSMDHVAKGLLYGSIVFVQLTRMKRQREPFARRFLRNGVDPTASACAYLWSIMDDLT